MDGHDPAAIHLSSAARGPGPCESKLPHHLQDPRPTWAVVGLRATALLLLALALSSLPVVSEADATRWAFYDGRWTVELAVSAADAYGSAFGSLDLRDGAGTLLLPAHLSCREGPYEAAASACSANPVACSVAFDPEDAENDTLLGTCSAGRSFALRAHSQRVEGGGTLVVVVSRAFDLRGSVDWFGDGVPRDAAASADNTEAYFF